MKRCKRPAHTNFQLFSAVALFSASAAFTACEDGDDASLPQASGGSAGKSAEAGGRAATGGTGSGGRSSANDAGSAGSGMTEGGATSASGGEAGTLAGAPSAGAPQDLRGGAGGSAGNSGGDAGAGTPGGTTSTLGGAGAGGESGAGGEPAACAPGYKDVGAGVCESSCAPRDFDGVSTVLRRAHTDLIAAAYSDTGGLQLFISDDSFPIRQTRTLRRTPESVLVQGKPSAQIQVPDIPALSGLLEAGSTVWMFPEGQPEAEALDLVWPGLQAYGLDYGVLRNDRTIVRLLSHEGAGKFLGFGAIQDEFTPPEVYFNLAGDIDEYYLDAGTHRHMGWTFTQSGVHRLRVELEATLVGGAIVKSAAHTYRFFLGELSELPSTEPTIVVAEGLEPSYSVGAELRLTAARYGKSSALPVAWARQCYGSGGDPGAWEPVGSSEAFSAVSQPGCQYVACLMNGTSVAAISQAVAPTFH